MDYNNFLKIMMESNEIVSSQQQMEAINIMNNNPSIMQKLTPDEQSWYRRSAFVGLKKEIYDKIIELSKNK